MEQEKIPINSAVQRALLFVGALAPGNLMALRLWLRGMPPYESHALHKYMREAVLHPDNLPDRAALEAALARRDSRDLDFQRDETGDLPGPDRAAPGETPS